jgi:hypothetical protein
MPVLSCSAFFGALQGKQYAAPKAWAAPPCRINTIEENSLAIHGGVFSKLKLAYPKTISKIIY